MKTGTKTARDRVPLNTSRCSGRFRRVRSESMTTTGRLLTSLTASSTKLRSPRNYSEPDGSSVVQPMLGPNWNRRFGELEYSPCRRVLLTLRCGAPSANLWEANVV